MSQLEYTSNTSRTEPGSRKEDYLRWRQRLADTQADLRHLGEDDQEPAVSSEWSPDALFKTGGPSTAPVDVAPADVAPVTGGAVPTSTGPEQCVPMRDVEHSPTSDAGWDRTEVEALLRQFRAVAGSPRTASRADGAEGGSGLAAAEPPVGRRPDLVQERDDRVERYFDGSRVVRTATVERARNAASVGDQLRELNRLRVEGMLDDSEFNRRKRELFARSSTLRRSSTSPATSPSTS
jgi:hypothetical protein